MAKSELCHKYRAVNCEMAINVWWHVKVTLRWTANVTSCHLLPHPTQTNTLILYIGSLIFIINHFNIQNPWETLILVLRCLDFIIECISTLMIQDWFASPTRVVMSINHIKASWEHAQMGDMAFTMVALHTTSDVFCGKPLDCNEHVFRF